jgi:hypothetical protein
MVEAMREIEFALQSRRLDGPATALGQHLQRHRPMAVVVGPVDRRRAALTEDVIDDVTLERLPRAQHRFRLGSTSLAAGQTG